MTRMVRPGDVFKLTCNFPTVTKQKYLVLAKRKSNRFFVINSEVNEFINNSDERRACQVDVPHLDHSSFLEYDSVADCYNVIDTHSVIQDSQLLFNDLHQYKVGRLKDYVIREIINALVNHNQTIKTKDKKSIIEQLQAQLT